MRHPSSSILLAALVTLWVAMSALPTTPAQAGGPCPPIETLNTLIGHSSHGAWEQTLTTSGQTKFHYLSTGGYGDWIRATAPLSGRLWIITHRNDQAQYEYVPPRQPIYATEVEYECGDGVVPNPIPPYCTSEWVKLYVQGAVETAWTPTYTDDPLPYGWRMRVNPDSFAALVRGTYVGHLTDEGPTHELIHPGTTKSVYEAFYACDYDAYQRINQPVPVFLPRTGDGSTLAPAQVPRR
jgi:hypothetical protein